MCIRERGTHEGGVEGAGEADNDNVDEEGESHHALEGQGGWVEQEADEQVAAHQLQHCRRLAQAFRLEPALYILSQESKKDKYI